MKEDSVEKPKKTRGFRKFIKRTFIIVFVLFSMLMTLAVIGFIADDQNNAQVTNQARVSADPLTTDTLFVDVNKVRTDNGIPATARDTALDASAQDKCSQMVSENLYEHKDKTGNPGTNYIFKHEQYALYGSENLNQGTFATATDVVNSWMGSPAHKAAMLDPKYTQAGYAICHLPSEPVGSQTVVQHLIQPGQPPSPQPQTRSSTFCNTQYYAYTNSATTHCQ